MRFHPHQRQLDEAIPLRSAVTALQVDEAAGDVVMGCDGVMCEMR